MYTLHGHSEGVNDARFDGKGEFLASVGGDEIVMVWRSNLGVDATGSIPRGPCTQLCVCVCCSAAPV